LTGQRSGSLSRFGCTEDGNTGAYKVTDQGADGSCAPPLPARPKQNFLRATFAFRDRRSPLFTSTTNGELQNECAGKNDGEPAIVVIDGRALGRERLAHGLRLHYAGAAVSTFASVAELLRAREDRPIISAILLSIGGLAITDDSVAAAVKQLKSEFAAVPFIILAESEDLVQIVGGEGSLRLLAA
jgi:hypothetical protein